MSLLRLLQDDDAATAVEYAVMLAMILMGVIGVISALGTGNGGMWSGIVNQLSSFGFH